MVDAASRTSGTAFIGASKRSQVFHALVAAALDPSRREADVPLRFFDTEAEARSWITERRRALEAKAR
jgi:hypothetical protein